MKLSPQKQIILSEHEWFVLRDNINQVKWRLKMNMTPDNRAALNILEQLF